MSIEEELHQTLLDNYTRAGKEAGYWGNYFLREARKKGGLATAKRLLLPIRRAGVAPGLQALIDAGRTDLSVEFVALEPRFRSLFTDDELAEARRRLDGLTAFTRRQPTQPAANFPGDLSDDAEFSEGALRRVTVNAYERDPAARAACITKHGLHCAVCGMSFEERYGSVGHGFIHVHHKKPLALRRGEYRLRASTDLVPVCPNCHAMLHAQNPPLGIDELQAIMQRHAGV
jgi:5-methylcytosine-specific restriction protein A